MNNYKRLFEQISPRESDEELIRKAMARKEESMKNDKNKSKHFLHRKSFLIPAVALLVLSAATISVGAATDWGYIEAFRNMFAKSYEGNVAVSSVVQSTVSTPAVISDSPAEADNAAASGSVAATAAITASTTTAPEQIEYVPEQPIGTFDFEEYGKPLGFVMRGDGVTATVDGMLAYNDLCYLMYTVEASDELLRKTGGVVPGLRIDFGNFGFKIDGKVAGGMGYSSETISTEGNKRTGCIEIHYDNVDLSGKTLNIAFLSEANIGGGNVTLISENKDILVDFPLAENIEREINLPLETSTFNGEITKISVGGFKTTLHFTGSSAAEPADAYEVTVAEDGSYIITDMEMGVTLYDELKAFGDAVITLKSGVTVTAKFDAMRETSRDGTKSGKMTLSHTYPIIPDDVVSIAFGKYNIIL